MVRSTPLQKVHRAVGLEVARSLEIITRAPSEELPGNPFSAFFSRRLRQPIASSSQFHSSLNRGLKSLSCSSRLSR